MEDDDQLTGQDGNTTAWIVVLAVAITCCAILFVVFANYLVSINKNLAISNTRLSVMEEREDQLLHEIQALHHDLAGSQGSANVPPKPAPAMLSAPPSPPPLPPVPSPTQDKSQASPPLVPPGTPPTAPAVAPVTSPTSVPEIPNTH